MKRKFSSLFLMVLMVFSVFPFTSFANDDFFPTYESLSVSPKEAAINEPVRFDLYAPDSAFFMLEARLTYLSPQGETREIILSGPDHWTGQYTATSFDEVGTWQLQSIYLYDDSYNRSLFTREQIDQPENYDFTILNEMKEPDVTAPTVDSVTFENEQVTAGGFAKVTVSASDDTDVEWVTLGLYNSSGRGQDYLTEFEKTDDGKFEATWWVPQYTDPGEWKVDWIYAGDAAGNQYNWDDNYGMDYPETYGTIQVINDHPDYTAPTVSSIQFGKNLVQAGEENSITIQAEDDLSGISYMSVELRNLYGQTIYADNMMPNEDGLWTGYFIIPSYMKSTTFKVASVYVRDQAGNVDHTFYEEQYPSTFGSFEVVNENEDDNAPTVQSVTFEKEKVTTEETNTVTVNATDDNSGIESIEIFLTSPTGKGKTNSYLYLNEEGRFTGEVYVPPYTEPGVWKVERIIAKDFAGNESDITYTEENYPETFGSFNVESSNFDHTPPTVNKVVFKTPEVKGNEEAQLTVYAEDAETVPAYAEVELISPSGTENLVGSTDYLDEDGLMQVTIQVPENAENGEWLVNKVKIIDLAGNEAEYTYTSEDYPADFGKLFVSNDQTAPASPKVDEVSDKSTSVKGTAEPLAKVAVMTNGNVLAEGKASEDGTFSIEVPAQKAGTILDVTAEDEAGNVSEKTSITVIDRTSPEAVVITEVTKVSVSGKAESDAMITVEDSNGTLISTGEADVNGNFTLTMEKQKNHDTIFVSVTDHAGNRSEKIKVDIKQKK